MLSLRCRSGFTLLEVAIAIAVVSIFTAAIMGVGKSFLSYAKNTRASTEASSMSAAAARLSISQAALPTESALKSVYPVRVVFGNSTSTFVNVYGKKLKISSADTNMVTVSMPVETGSTILAPLTWTSGSNVNISSVVDHGVADEVVNDKKRLYGE